MLGKTHHAGGTVAALAAFEIMKTKGMLIPDCNVLLQLMIMYPFASFGSIYSDLDQGDSAIPSKDPFAVGLHKIIRATGAKHRSWQTHSIYFTGLLSALMLLAVLFIDIPCLSSVDIAFLQLSVIGFVSGLYSHLVLDMLTTGGVWVIPGKKLRLVPKSSTFATGGTWESIVFYILMVCIVLLVGKNIYDVYTVVSTVIPTVI